MITSRSGQWSRCSVTGTDAGSAIVRNMFTSTSAPIERTVLTEVWTISGERTSSAAAITASSVRSLTTLNAATP